MRSAAGVDSDRDRPDACPGALTVHPAADGGLARIRVPGGFATGEQLATIAAAARQLGTGVVELTSRANVQIRGLAAGAEAELGARIAAVGLLPSRTHERVRNIVASPLAAVDNDIDLHHVVVALDRDLCAHPSLAELPGRFLFALDDGRGDVATLGADVTAIVGATTATVEGNIVDDPVAAMLRVAAAFLGERDARGSQVWRVAELGRDAVLERAGLIAHPPGLRSTAAAPAGLVRQRDGRDALVVLAPLGRLTPAQLERIAAHAGARGVRVTPWRSVVIPDLRDADVVATDLVAAGLGVDRSSRWFGVTACTGRPGCAKALADVQADAAIGAQRWTGRVVHWSGCERRCGRPHDTAVDVVATGAGYDVTEVGAS